MRKPAVDYRNFSFRKMNSPEFSHLWLLLGWPVYFVLFFLTENWIPREACTSVHMCMDDWIPFCEYFVIPYVMWYGLIVYSLVWFALYNVQGFRQLQTWLIITQVCAILIYVLFPSRQDLRPQSFPRGNFCADLVRLLYAMDTNTGVCPSMHVAFSLGIASVWMKEKQVGRWWKTMIVVLALLVCMSTVFIKQHSAVDFFAALPVCLLSEILVYRVVFPGK